jgi:hypothetical protein
MENINAQFTEMQQKLKDVHDYIRLEVKARQFLTNGLIKAMDNIGSDDSIDLLVELRKAASKNSPDHPQREFIAMLFKENMDFCKEFLDDLEKEDDKLDELKERALKLTKKRSFWGI